jgi:hypothetical protein
MNKAIPDGGRSVKCARCGHQWRLLPDEPEELTEALETEAEAQASPAAEAPAHGHQPHAYQSQEAESDAEAAQAEEARRQALQARAEEWSVAQAQSAFSSEEQSSLSWEARRGNLAAAIASLSDAPGANPAEAEAESAEARSWTGDMAGYNDYGSPRDEDEAANAEADNADEAPSEVTFRKVDPTTWPHSVWPESDREAADAASTPSDRDPETSIREVLQAAMDDQAREAANAFQAQDTPFHAKDTPTSYPRSIFDDAPFERPDTQTAAETEDTGTATAESDNEPSVARIAFSLREGHFPPAGTISLKQTDDPSAEGPEDTERFESDIAGLFKQQPQSKRSFGHALGKRRTVDDFADYDGDSAAAAEQSDERSMADSPLDADAAALQAALEGSLREKHASENRGASSGGGGLALAAAWAVFISVLSGVSLAFVNFREEIVEALPGTAALYRGVGFDVQERLVDFGPVTYRWTMAEGKPMIEVTGQIINLTDREIAVPRVLVQVHDKENTDTVKASATVRSEPLAARESADFTLEFLAPPRTITQIELAFADTD